MNNKPVSNNHQSSILIVDDEPDIRALLKRSLVGEGFKVWEAGSGIEGIGIFMAGVFDLVITDIRMPGMDGIEVIRQVKALDPDVEVIVLTGFATLENAIAALRYEGAYDYLQKPLEDIERLFLSVRQALERRRLRMENAALSRKLNAALAERISELSAIVDAMADGVIVTDMSGCIAYANNRVAEALGSDKGTLMGKTILEFVNDTDRGPCKDAVIRLVSQKGTSTDVELRTISRQGKEMILKTRFTILYGPEGEPQKIISVGRDISEEKRMIHELDQARAKSESASKAKSDFIAGMSHELRTPLTVIIGFAELLRLQKLGSLNQAQARYAGLIYDNAMHLLSLINNVIEYSALEADGKGLEKAQVSLETMIAECLGMVGDAALRRRISLEKVIFHEVSGIQIEGDKAGIKRAMGILLDNAIKFTPEGGRVRVEAERSDERTPDSSTGQAISHQKSSIQISISDTGIGLKPEEMEHILEPFFQAGDVNSQKSPGIGLNMALARRLIEMQGGRIWAESEGLGKGTTVRFTVGIAN